MCENTISQQLYLNVLARSHLYQMMTDGTLILVPTQWDHMGFQPTGHALLYQM